MSFLSLYKKLNKEQKKAVETIEGPVMVIAGPGTGKTRTLTLRIANILQKTDTEPENILAITFTESGVNSIRNKLIEIMGSTAYSISIFTFHGFCNHLIQEYPDDFPLFINSSNILEVDKIKIIQDLIEQTKLDYLKPTGDPSFYVKSINQNIAQLKREGVGWKKFLNIIKKEKVNFEKIDDLYNKKGILKGKYQELLKQINKNSELAYIYQKYQEKLQELGSYDYEDMIMTVLNIFTKNKDFLLKIQEKYLYFLVDEYQDDNNAQNKILELLCNFHKNPNVFVVGDEKQAIYRFQGASLENFYYFQKLYPRAQIIKFVQNYRSSSNILKAADNIIPGEKLKPNNNFKNKLGLNIFPDPESEQVFIGQNLPPKGSIAILARENKDVFSLANILKKQGIDFAVEADQDILKDNDIKKIILLFKLINDFSSKELFFEALHVDFLNINPLSIYSKKKDKKIENFRKTIASLVIEAKNKTLPEFFEVFLEKTGLLKYALKQGKLEKINLFFNEIKIFTENKSANLKDFLNYLELLEKYNIFLKKNQSTQKRIKIMTAHKAKGLEFDYVFIIKTLNGIWSNKRYNNPLKLCSSVFSLTGEKVEKQNPKEEERRLFYVALTRARKQVFISYFNQDLEKKEKLPCLFLSEIDKNLFIVKKHNQVKRKILIKEKKPKQNKDFILELFKKRGFSATSLNNYLACPWKYFYLNLLRIPRAKQNHQIYGTAVHQALRDFFVHQGQIDLIKRFIFYLEKEFTNKDVLERFLEKGKTALQLFLEKEHNFNAFLEFKIPGILLDKNTKIQGRLDKVEFLENGVKVTDFKTGKPRTRNYIEGKTKNSSGDIKRQLIFYKLLLDNYKKKKYNMVSAQIDFIEPNERGKLKKEEFIIREQEVEELKKVIKKSSQEIRNFQFWNKGCQDKNCEFCRMREMMK